MDHTAVRILYYFEYLLEKGKFLNCIVNDIIFRLGGLNKIRIWNSLKS
jgi:hypothetical protein